MKKVIKSSILLGVALFISTTFFSQEKNKQLAKPINESTMKEYILLNRVPSNYGPVEAKQVREAWDKVLKKWKSDSLFVISFVFPNEGYVISGSEKIAKKEIVLANNMKIVSTIILKAKNFEDIIELAKECPIIEQGGTVEICEVQPRPITSKKK